MGKLYKTTINYQVVDDIIALLAQKFKQLSNVLWLMTIHLPPNPSFQKGFSSFGGSGHWNNQSTLETMATPYYNCQYKSHLETTIKADQSAGEWNQGSTVVLVVFYTPHSGSSSCCIDKRFGFLALHNLKSLFSHSALHLNCHFCDCVGQPMVAG